MQQSSREFDLLIYGATGYTGRLVAQEWMRAIAGTGLRWGLMGRDAGKLAAVRDALGAGADVPILVADSSDPASLERAAALTASVLTTVGPYQLYGEQLLAACVRSGTDYLDLSGEPAWMAQMIAKYEGDASKTGARILFSCGFDSIPFDAGVWFLQDQAIRAFGKPLQRVRGRVRTMRGSFSGGTQATLKHTQSASRSDGSVLADLRNPFCLTPGFVGPAQPDDRKPSFDQAVDSWVTPFVMAPINSRNVHRTNFLLGHPYGTDFAYDEMLMTGQGEKGQQLAERLASHPGLPGPERAPGEGPSDKELVEGFYDLLFVGTTVDGRELRASVRGDVDPGYASTARMIVQSALCLGMCRANGPRGGIWSPVAALGAGLIERLQSDAGMIFGMEGELDRDI
ncbi:MAG: saccharopine dehydrogenase NADP-binding domain-containing protein [Alphaproteobacteria bacterium]|nr:saccharopine dehydrogenase NADP-binding domain-containing protein [Alphaproteobacteria bacterium]